MKIERDDMAHLVDIILDGTNGSRNHGGTMAEYEQAIRDGLEHIIAEGWFPAGDVILPPHPSGGEMMGKPPEFTKEEGLRAIATLTLAAREPAHVVACRLDQLGRRIAELEREVEDIRKASDNLTKSWRLTNEKLEREVATLRKRLKGANINHQLALSALRDSELRVDQLENPEAYRAAASDTTTTKEA